VTAPGRVGGVLLAAGGGTRFGGPKALVRLHGTALAQRGARLLADGGCAPVVVVAGAEAAQVRALDLGAAEVVANPRWAEGMGTSLRAGLAALEGRCDAAVVALADQPLVGAEAVRRLVAAWEAGARAAVATYGGAPRNPVLLDAAAWPAATAAARGDVGARALLRRADVPVAHVPCDGTGRPDDVDTPADLDRIRSLTEQEQPCS
jgi:CTP:molybdopterin cytidylyltransferase MocA